jgi:hypothetical protein
MMHYCSKTEEVATFIFDLNPGQEPAVVRDVVL